MAVSEGVCHRILPRHFGSPLIGRGLGTIVSGAATTSLVAGQRAHSRAVGTPGRWFGLGVRALDHPNVPLAGVQT